MRRRVLLLPLMLLLLALPALAQAKPDAEVLKLGIIHTNDIHGHLQPFFVDGEAGWGGAARLAAAIDAARADDDYEWLVLDAGDACPGTLISDEQRWLPVLDCMNRVGYDAMCLGNGEFSWGLAQARDYLEAAEFPLLCANIATDGDGVPPFPPYAVFHRGGCQIGVIGLARESFTQDLYYKLGHQVRFCPVEPTAASLAYYLRWIGCDIIIALTHQGFIYDLELARTLPELHVVVGGHSHTFMSEPERIGNAVVTQDGEWARTLGILKLDFVRDDASQRFVLSGCSEEFKPLGPDQPADGEMAAMVDQYQRQLDQLLGEVVCENAREVSVERVRFEENALANLVADALRELSGADCVLFTGGNFQAALPAGPVTFGDFCKAMPLDHPVMKVAVSGAVLREILNWAGTQYGRGFPQVAGMRLRYVDARLAAATVNGREIDDDAEYTVLMIDYVACNVPELPLHEDPHGPAATELKQRSAFIDWARQRQVLRMATDGRVVFEWAEGAPPAQK